MSTSHARKSAPRQPKLAPRKASKVAVTKTAKQSYRPNSIGHASILACTNWLPCHPVSTAICERTGLTVQWVDDLGAAYMASYACHPRFLPGAWQHLQGQLANRQQATQLDPRLIAGAVLYLLTKPRPGSTPIIHHVTTLELSVINTGLAQLGTDKCLRLYNLAASADWSGRALAVSSLAETHGIPLERFASEVASFILRQDAEQQEALEERHHAKAIERKELAGIDRQFTIQRKATALAEQDCEAALHRWLRPWATQQEHWTLQIRLAPERASTTTEIALWVARDKAAAQAAASYKALGITSLVKDGAFRRLSELKLSELIATLEQLAEQANSAQSWTSQDQQVKYQRSLALLRKELAAKASFDDTCLD